MCALAYVFAYFVCACERVCLCLWVCLCAWSACVLVCLYVCVRVCPMRCACVWCIYSSWVRRVRIMKAACVSIMMWKVCVCKHSCWHVSLPHRDLRKIWSRPSSTLQAARKWPAAGMDMLHYVILRHDMLFLLKMSTPHCFGDFYYCKHLHILSISPFFEIDELRHSHSKHIYTQSVGVMYSKYSFVICYSGGSNRRMDAVLTKLTALHSAVNECAPFRPVLVQLFTHVCLIVLVLVWCLCARTCVCMCTFVRLCICMFACACACLCVLVMLRPVLAQSLLTHVVALIMRAAVSFDPLTSLRKVSNNKSPLNRGTATLPPFAYLSWESV